MGFKLCKGADVGAVVSVEELAEQATDFEKGVALRRAAEDGQLEVVQFLAEKQRAVVDTAGDDGYTALIAAAGNGHTDIVKYLVSRWGVDVNAKTHDQDNTTLTRTDEYGVVQHIVRRPRSDKHAKTETQGYTALIRAAENGHRDVVDYLVSQCGADVNAKTDYNGHTALTSAAENGHTDVVKYLAGRCDANVNYKDNTGSTALMRAARNGHLDVVMCLAGQCGANVHDGDNGRETALMKAAENGHVDVVRYLASERGANVNAKGYTKNTALIKAAENGHVDVVKYLSNECGANVSAETYYGYTALMMAAYNGHKDVIQFLADERGVDVNAKSKGDETALIRAAANDKVDTMRFLVDGYGADVNAKGYNGNTALIMAAKEGHMDAVRFLTDECGAEVNVRDDRGYTALMVAAENDHLTTVRFLANEHGADVNIKSNDGYTALMMTAGKGNMEIVGFLAGEHGADVNVKDASGYTALIRAAENGRMDIVRFLADERDADVNAKDDSGYTALIRSAENNSVDIVRFLADEHGADVNAKTSGGYTLLMWASQHGSIDIVRFLTEQHGANVNATDNNGHTALMRAAKHGRFDIVEYLVDQCGADANAKDDGGATVLMKAAEYDELRFSFHGGEDAHARIVHFLAGQVGAAVNDKDYNGTTALMWAAKKGNLHAVTCLVDHFAADTNARDNDGVTALMHASDHVKIVHFLAERVGAAVNDKDNKGYTSLIWAAKKGNVDAVKCLVDEYAADVNAKDKDGHSALMWAARSVNTDMVRLLVEGHVGAVDVKNNYGRTVLMCATEKGSIDAVRYLVAECGVDLNTRDAGGFTALMLAAKNGRVKVVQYLVEECGADVNVKSNDGTNAVRLAANGGYFDIQPVLRPYLFLDNKSCVDDMKTSVNGVLSFSDHQLRCSIPPSEVQLTDFSTNGYIGGDFQAKWLDADAVVKLFIPDASHSSFEDEVRLWKRLRHPNVLKMYGACQAGPQLQFFVCEYASQGSLWELISLASGSLEDSRVCKYLHEAALGLEYLHERGIIHGDLRCNNILIGSDGMAKLSDFSLSGLTKKPRNVHKGTMPWQAPEVLRGGAPSFQSDVYSLGMCLWEASSGDLREAYEEDDDEFLAEKFDYAPEDSDSDYGSESSSGFNAPRAMLCQDPHKRATLSYIVHRLERMAAQNISDGFQPELEPACSFAEYEYGRLEELWVKLVMKMEHCDSVEYSQLFDELKIIHDRLQERSHHPTLFVRFYALLTEFYQTATLSPEQVRVMHLSSTRATTTSIHAFQWRINSLTALLGGSTDLPTQTEARWQQQRLEQVERFVSGVSDTFLLLNDLKTAEERSSFLKVLKVEMGNHGAKYSPEQIATMEEAFAVIASTLESNDVSELTPEWFIPWYELIIDEWNCLGEGGFGSVKRAKWLDSDVVVKQVLLSGSENSTGAYTTLSSLSVPEELSAIQAQTDANKRAETRAMFLQEVEIWFGFSHPHVIRLFGACHVGRPFFVCEYATNGTLVSYLRKHPDEIWAKLLEAALGVQYLHARNVVHGDLKGNNIVVGSDNKAKVTDFGLSSVASSENKAQVISGAWQWVAPELLDTNKRPTFASDMYSLGMCIVEALRVVEAVKSDGDSRHCLPWRVTDRSAVRYHATRGELPSRPPLCKDNQWELVKKMCALDPQKRIKISTVVDELAKLANVSASSQPSNLGDTSLRDLVNWKSVGKIIVAVQRQLSQPQDSGNHHDEVLILHISLWKSLERVYKQIDGDFSDECRAAFCSLVTDANDAATKLQGTDKNLVSFAQATMRCYALGRSLSKLCDAYFIATDEPVVNVS